MAVIALFGLLLSFKTDADTLVVSSSEGDDKTLNLDVGAFVKKLHVDNKDMDKGTLSRESMSLSAKNARFEVKVYFSHIFGNFVDEKLVDLNLGESLIVVEMK